MKQLKKDLQAISNILKQLTKKIETIAKKLDKLEKAKPARKAKAKTVRKVKVKATRKAKAKTVRKVKVKATRKAKPKAVKKAPKVSASGTVLTLVRRSRKGIGVATLREKSGLEGRKINDIVHRLKREGKIKAIGRGIYVKA